MKNTHHIARTKLLETNFETFEPKSSLKIVTNSHSYSYFREHRKNAPVKRTSQNITFVQNFFFFRLCQEPTYVSLKLLCYIMILMYVSADELSQFFFIKMCSPNTSFVNLVVVQNRTGIGFSIIKSHKTT